MNDGAFWESFDAGSASGKRQLVAPSATYTRLRAARAALAEHLERCQECGIGTDTWCEAGRQLDKAHRAVENPDPIPGGALSFLANRPPTRQHTTPGDTE